MRTFKSLAKGARGIFSGLVWPRPWGPRVGDWITADGPLVVGGSGIHLCRAKDLAHWLHDELWEAEHEGDAIAGDDCLVVRRARLVRRIEGWTADGAKRFAEASIAHASAMIADSTAEDAHGFLDDARMATSSGYAVLGAFSAARAVAAMRALPEPEQLAVYRAERAWQSAWLDSELAL